MADELSPTIVFIGGFPERCSALEYSVGPVHAAQRACMPRGEVAPGVSCADEIDAIGTKRYEATSGGEREIQRTMLELLNQLDGFDSMGDVKVVLHPCMSQASVGPADCLNFNGFYHHAHMLLIPSSSLLCNHDRY